MTIAGATRLIPAPNSVVKVTPACWLAVPSQVKSAAAAPLTSRKAQATKSRPPSQDVRETGSNQDVVEPALGLFGAGSGDLAGGKKGDQDREDQKARAEHSTCASPRRSELGKDLLGRTRESGTSRPGDKAKEKRRQGDRHPPADDTRPLHSDGKPRRAEEQPEMGPGVHPVRHDALSDVTPAREGDSANGEQGAEADDRQEGQGLRRRERLELLDPAQRGDPDQPMEAHSGIGDQADGIAHAEEGRSNGSGLAAGGRQLAGDGPDGDEHDRRCHHGQGEVQRGSSS